MSSRKLKEAAGRFMPVFTGKRFIELFYNFHLPLFSGILLVLIQPPVSFFPLAFFALIPLLDSIKKENLRSSFFIGYVAGVVSYLGLIYWVIVAMHRYGGIDIYLSFLILLLFVLYLSFYTGIFTLSCAWFERTFSIPVYLSAPLVWVLLEYVRGFLMSGFPWSFLSHSQYNFLPMIQVVSLTGSYFISFLIVAINGLIYCFWRKQKPFIPYAVVIVFLLAATLVYGFVSLAKKQETPLNAAIVQGNIRQDVKWDEKFKAMTINKYLKMTLDDAKNVDLTIWPETAMPLLFDKEIYANKYIKALPGSTNTLLLFGAMSQSKSGKLRNSSYVLGKTGETIGIYSKVHLVPFGEYTPLLSYLPFFEKLTAAGGDFVPGEGHMPIKTDIGKIGILICYEGAFPSITNETVREGAQVLVNLTNDAWYERTSAPYQHFAFYIFRAIETDRYMLRAANTGISAIIDPQGHVEKKTPIFVDAVLKGSFAMRDTKTFYVQYGDYFIVIALLGVAVLVIASRFRKSMKR